MVPEGEASYSFLRKKTQKEVLPAFEVFNSSVVHNWVSMLNAMPVAPKNGVTSCGAIGTSTRTIEVVFASSSNGDSSATVAMNSDCGHLPKINSTTLWDPTGRFWNDVTGYKVLLQNLTA